MAEDSLKQLSQKAKQRREEHQKQLDAETENALKQHAESLRNWLESEANTTKEGISGHLREIIGLIENLESSTKEARDSTKTTINNDLKKIRSASTEHRNAALNTLRWGWLRYSLPMFLLLLTILAANWGLIQWQSNRLMETQQQIDQAQQTLDQLPAGVEFARDSGNDYLILGPEKPNLYRVESGDWVVKLKKQ